eukprot:9374506-Alexandrium_andersonii.AAC.1
MPSAAIQSANVCNALTGTVSARVAPALTNCWRTRWRPRSSGEAARPPCNGPRGRRPRRRPRPA